MSYRNAPNVEVTYRQRTPASAEMDARGLATFAHRSRGTAWSHLPGLGLRALADGAIVDQRR